MELKGKRVLFMGDSITNGFCASSMEKCWTNVFTRSSGAVCLGNFGVNGTRIARQRVTVEDKDIWNEPFTERVDRMPPEADIVLVFGGTNDWGHGDAPFGTPEDQTDDTFCGALNVLYRKLLAKYPAARVVVMTPLHCTEEDRPCGRSRYLTNKERPPLKAYVEAIRAACERYSIPVCDLYRNSGISTDVPEQAEIFLDEDGLHPNDTGYARIAEGVESFLRTL